MVRKVLDRKGLGTLTPSLDIVSLYSTRRREAPQHMVYLNPYPDIVNLDYYTLLDSQDNACAICKTKEFGKHGPHIDHNHITKKVRGILCHQCNLGLGQFKDNIEKLKLAIEYLEKNK